MTTIWKITYPGGTGYSNDAPFENVIETNLANGKLDPDRWIIDMVIVDKHGQIAEVLMDKRTEVSTCPRRKTQTRG
jgi:hypothetical protein